MKTTLLFVLTSALAFGQGSSLDTKQRVKTVRDLGKGGPDSVPRIAPYVKDPDVSVRIEAVKALDNIGGPQTVDPLLIAAKDSDAEIQIRATDGLINVYLPGYIKNGMSGSISRVGNSIKAKFSDTNDKIIDAYVMVRPGVIAALGNLAKNGATVDARANAARAIGILRGRAAIPDLIEALRSKDDPVMYEALIALQKIRDPASGPKMAFVVHDLNDRIQIAALETTGILANKETAPDVRDALSHARDNKVRRAALEALGMLADAQDRDTFLRYLNDKDESLRASAAEGLGRLKNPSDRPALQTAFNNERKMSPRLSDAFALVDLGDLETSEFSPLRYLINTLDVRAYRDVASPFLTELARDASVRRAIYPMLTGATKDEKIQLSIVLARSGDRDALPFLRTLSTDPDTDVAQEGIRSLRNLQARIP